MNVTIGHVMQIMEYVQIYLDLLHVHVLQDSLVMDLVAQVTNYVTYPSLSKCTHIHISVKRYLEVIAYILLVLITFNSLQQSSSSLIIELTVGQWTGNRFYLM